MLNSILPYSIKVFFAMRLVFSEWFCINLSFLGLDAFTSQALCPRILSFLQG